MDLWPIKFHPLASQELHNAASWYHEINDELASSFIECIDVAIERVAHGPGRWPVCFDKCRQILVDRFPYVLIYRVMDEDVHILAVAHAKREPGYWLDRK